METSLYTLQKLSHATYRKFFGCKNENFQRKICDIFLIFAKNIDCGYTLEPGKAVLTSFWIKNKKKNTHTYPCKPQFYYIKVWYKGVYISRTCIPDEVNALCSR